MCTGSVFCLLAFREKVKRTAYSAPTEKEWRYLNTQAGHGSGHLLCSCFATQGGVRTRGIPDKRDLP